MLYLVASCTVLFDTALASVYDHSRDMVFPFLQVWRRRHYRVKPAVTPGTFRFSVLDNGVVSNEYWRIIDVSDDLSWGE